MKEKTVTAWSNSDDTERLLLVETVDDGVELFQGKRKIDRFGNVYWESCSCLYGSSTLLVRAVAELSGNGAFYGSPAE